MADVGRNTLLTDELVVKIKECILDNKTLKETANICGIESNTLYRWSCDNYANLSDKIEGWRRDYKLKKADENIDAILELDVKDKDFTKTIADISKFVKETLDKENYSKRSELTGKDGGSLIVQTVSYADKDNSNTPQV